VLACTNLKVLAVVLVVIVAAGMAVVTMLSPQPRQSEPLQNIQQTTQTNTAATQPTTSAPRIVALTLYLNDYGYNASKGGPHIVAYVGDLVRIRLVGNGSGPVVHDFTLDQDSPSPYSVERLRRGQEQIIEFVANFEGVYKYYCSVKGFSGPSHRERGQEGTIEILRRS
jgi:plastocyanin